MEEIIEKLKNFNPISIFVYGSYATNTQNSYSDIEMGVIFDDKNFVKSEQLIKAVNNSNYSVFSFKEKDLKNYTIDTPFEKNIYILSLASGNAKTVFGKKIVENLNPPITKQNLLSDTSFNLGYALCAYRLCKTGDTKLSNEMLYKSLFFATRNLIYTKTKKLISDYNTIYHQAKKLNLCKEYAELLDLAYNLRNDKKAISQKIDSAKFIENITYINKFIIEEINNSDI